MGTLFKKLWSTGIIGNFLAGLFVLLPIVLTVFILNWIITQVANVLGPGTMLGGILSSGGGKIVGPNNTWLAFLVGLLIALVSIWFVGLIIKSQARQQLRHGIDHLFEQLPFINSIYKPVAQVVRVFSQDGGQDLQGMTVVTCRLGGTSGVDLLGLMTSPKTFVVGGQNRRLVYVPTSPLPLSGGLILVPEDKIILMPDLEVDDLMQIYLSLGVVTPDSITPGNSGSK